MSLTNAFSVALKKHSSALLSLFFSLSLCVFSLCESKSALFITPHDESSDDETLRSAKERYRIDDARTTLTRVNRRRNLARGCLKTTRARVYATTTLATAFVKRRRRLYRARGTRCAVQSPKRTRVVCPFFVRLFFSHFRIKFARRKTQNSSWYVSLVASLSRSLSLSLNFCLFETRRTNLVRARIERERGERAFANKPFVSLFFSFA